MTTAVTDRYPTRGRASAGSIPRAEPVVWTGPGTGPIPDADESGLPAGHPQQPTTATGKSASTELASTAARQANAIGSVFVSNQAPAGRQSVPASKPVQHLAAVKQVKPRTQLAAPPVKVLQVQAPIQLVQAGLSLGAGPLVLLGLVVIGGLATVIAGTRRRHSPRHS